jgi:uncharacterized protein YgbK (DUF1537 family)
MTDSNLVSVLGAQTARAVGLIDYTVVTDGAKAIRSRIDALRGEGVTVAIVDAISNDDLVHLAAAVRGMPLVTAGSGLAIGLPANWGFAPSRAATRLPPPDGRRAIVSGSVSAATNRQVYEYLRSGRPAFNVDPLRVAAGADIVGQALAFAEAHLADGPVMVYSTESPHVVREVQDSLGTAESGALVERTLARVAQGLVERGVRQLVVAGGETSGAVVQALGLTGLRIGPQIDPGVPWCAATLPGGDTLHITLKSGNFGSAEFFTAAFAVLDREAAA